MAASRNNNEDGFILIAAIWLLILCGSVAALLLARSMAAARAVSTEAEELRTKLTLDAAIETVAADLLINGNRSRYAMAPTERSIDVGGRRVTIRIGAESGKLDLNEADLAMVDRVLAGLGWEAAERAIFLQQLRTRRVEHEPLRSTEELRRIAALSRPGDQGSDNRECLKELLTVHSGRSDPEPAFAGAALSRLLGRRAHVGEVERPRPIGPGTPIVLHASLEGTAATRAIMRLGGRLDQPLLVSSWGFGSICR